MKKIISVFFSSNIFDEECIECFHIPWTCNMELVLKDVVLSWPAQYLSISASSLCLFKWCGGFRAWQRCGGISRELLHCRMHLTLVKRKIEQSLWWVIVGRTASRKNDNIILDPKKNNFHNMMWAFFFLDHLDIWMQNEMM